MLIGLPVLIVELCSSIQYRTSLADEQRQVAQDIMNAVNGLHDARLMFLEGAAGTGKTFTIGTVIDLLRSIGRTGIAAAQYPSGTTLHSLFKLGIDEAVGNGFRSAVGRGSVHGNYLAHADLIMIDELSMLTPLVAKRISLTLKSVCHSDE
jgi:hypothetical protein